MTSQSDVSRLYRSITSQTHIDSVVRFIKFGVPINIEAFDAMLKYSIDLLTPVYTTFLLHVPEGSVIRENVPELMAEIFDISTAIIQCAWRRKGARLKVKRILKAIQDSIEEVERQKFLK